MLLELLDYSLLSQHLLGRLVSGVARQQAWCCDLMRMDCIWIMHRQYWQQARATMPVDLAFLVGGKSCRLKVVLYRVQQKVVLGPMW